MAKQTFTEIKKELDELKSRIKDGSIEVKDRIGKKDFYQGMVYGACAMAIIVILKHIIF